MAFFQIEGRNYELMNILPDRPYLDISKNGAIVGYLPIRPEKETSPTWEVKRPDNSLLGYVGENLNKAKAFSSIWVHAYGNNSSKANTNGGIREIHFFDKNGNRLTTAFLGATYSILAVEQKKGSWLQYQSFLDGNFRGIEYKMDRFTSGGSGEESDGDRPMTGNGTFKLDTRIYISNQKQEIKRIRIYLGDGETNLGAGGAGWTGCGDGSELYVNATNLWGQERNVAYINGNGGLHPLLKNQYVDVSLW